MDSLHYFIAPSINEIQRIEQFTKSKNIPPLLSDAEGRDAGISSRTHRSGALI